MNAPEKFEKYYELLQDPVVVGRMGLALVIFSTGVSKFLAPDYWTVFAPTVLSAVIGPKLFVFVAGALEASIGAKLFFPHTARSGAFIASIWLFLVVSHLFITGHWAVALHDIGLLVLAVVVYFQSPMPD